MKHTRATVLALLTNLVMTGSAIPQESNSFSSKQIAIRDARAIANAKWLNKKMIEAFHKAKQHGDVDPFPVFLWTIMGYGIPKSLKPTCPELLELKNPWAGVEGAPDLAFSSQIGILGSLDRDRSGVVKCTTNLGQVYSYLEPRNPLLDQPTVVCTSVRTFRPFFDQSVGLTNIFTLFTIINEKNYDTAAKIITSKLHRQIIKRYRRAKASSLPLESAASFQFSIFGKSPTNTEVPTYWAFHPSVRIERPLCSPMVIAESSSQGAMVREITEPSNLWQIQTGYFPGDSSSPPVLFSAVYLLHSIESINSPNSHIYMLKTALP